MTTIDRLRVSIKNNFPQLASLVRKLRIDFYFRSSEDIFRKFYQERKWGGSESASGSGSDLQETLAIRKALPAIIRELDIRTILDAPCGDFHWMKEVYLDLDNYYGVDIVPEIIEKNNELFGNEKIEFLVKDITKDDLPQVDLILCRDCLVHFSFTDIKNSLKNFKKSKSIFLLTTTFTSKIKNNNIVTGGWRKINLQLPPFNFPTPIKMIDEKCSLEGGIHKDKCLCLWRIDQIKIE